MANGVNGKGGLIALTGNTVSLVAATIEAWGATGGGDIDIGGGPHSTVALADAQSVSVDSVSSIDADARKNGNGGHIVVWSDGLTTAQGSFSAKGGANGGNGGLIETSGESVDFTGIRVDTSAANAQFGTWLVDPVDLIIDNTAATTIENDLATTDVTLQTFASGAPSGPAGTTGNTNTSGSGDIDVDASITWNSGATLTLNAYNAINVNQSISNDSPYGNSGLTLIAHGTSNGGGITVNANITNGSAGEVTLTAPNLAFAQGASLSFAGVSGGLPEGSLSINGKGYTLVNSVAQLASDASGNLGGAFALVGNLTATGSYSTGVIAAGNSSGIEPTPFSGTLEGLGHTISGLTITTGGGTDYYVGLIGALTGTVRDIGLVGANVQAGGNSHVIGSLVGDNAGGTVVQAYATGVVNGGSGSQFVGGLVGYNNGGTITQAYASVAVSGMGSVGGLVGQNENGTINQAYATGAVSGTGTSISAIGGLVGDNQATIENSYATGAVTGGSGSAYVGGLVGYALGGTVREIYATGAVTGAAYVGGLVGRYDSGAVQDGYYDADTTGQALGTQSNGSVGLTTLALQTTGVLLNVDFSGGAAGGTNGIYPYLVSFFPNGVQAVSGIAYKDAGATPLASNSNGADTVSVIANGAAFGSATTGANGYYYVFGQAGSFASGNSVLAYTAANAATGSTNAATVATATNAANQAGINIYGNAVTIPTTATSLTALGGFAAVQNAALNADGGIAAAAAAIQGAPDLRLIASGPGFVVDAPVTTAGNVFVQTTTSGAPIIVSQSITIESGASLGLSAAGALNIEAPITVQGAATVALSYDQNTTTPSAADLSFDLQSAGFRGSLSFESASGSALSSSAGGALSINGQSYTLLYSMAGVAGVSGSGAYALATNNIDASGSSYQTAVVPWSSPFSGTLEGLGNTISNLTISGGGDVGLIGYLEGTVRDIGLTGESVSGSDNVGGLVGYNLNGTISQSYASGTISGQEYVGGLVGESGGTITQAYASVTVSGSTYVGGLVGENDLTITQSYATGAVRNGDYVGGLVGYNNGGTITQSYATGAVSGSEYIGGLVGYSLFGYNNSGTITQSYATGAVSGSTFYIGGLVGFNQEAITQAYATGAVSGSEYIGGLVGENYSGSTITQAYATGAVRGSSQVGGLVGNNAGTVSYSYWDMQTSGTGYDPSSGSIGLTTAQLQGALPGGFSNTVWGTGSGLYPYFLWQYPTTPQAVSGIAYSNLGATVAAGATVSALVNGASLGTVSSGADGYYYFLTPYGTISPTGSQLLVYTSGTSAGASYQQNATGSVSGLNIDGTYLTETTPASTYSAVTSGLSTAIGGDSAAHTLIGGLANLQINASASAFTVDRTINTRALILSAAGDLTIAAGAQVTGGTNDNVVLSAAGIFTNDEGSDAVSVSGTGRWLIYSKTPSDDTFDNLNSNNTAIWDTTYPAAVSASGDRYVFAYQPTLTFTSTDTSKTYGIDDSTALATDYTVSGYQGVANAFLTDTAANVYSGAPTLTSSGSTATANVNGGPYTITIDGNGLTSLDGYKFAFDKNGKLTVDPATLTYTANSANMTYGGGLPSLSGAVTGFVNNETLSSATTGALTWNTSATSSSNVGSYGINGSGLTANHGNYTFVQAVGNVTALTINPAPITVTALGGNSTYGQSPSNPGLSATGLQNGQTVSVLTGLSNSFGINNLTNAGGYSLSVAGTLANSNYTVAGANTGTWTVNPAQITVTALGGNSTYGQSPSNPGFSATGLQNGQGVSALSGLSNSFGINNLTNAGSYTLSVNGALANPNYTITALNTGTWVVNPAQITVTVNGGNSTYGQSPSDPGFSAAGLQNGQDVSVLTGLSNSFGINNLTNAGSYTLGVNGALSNPNYTIAMLNTGTWVVNPAQITVTANSGNSTYGQSPSNPGFSATGLQNGQDVSVLTGLSNSFGINNLTNAGSYTLKVTGALANSNYIVTGTNSGAWTVNPAQIAVTANGGNSTYGQSPSNPGLSATGLQNGQDGSVLTGLSNSFGINNLTNAGSYTLSVNGALTNPNYTVTTLNTSSWVVNSAQITVTANGGNSTYGQSPSNPGLSATGLQNGQDVSVLAGLSNSFGITNLSNAGNYTLNVAGTLTNSNYAVAGINSGTWVVNPAQLTVTANGGTSTYGQSPSNPGLSATGLQNGQDVSVLAGLSSSFGITNLSNAGNYTLNVAGILTNPNYTVGGTNGGSWTVNPAQIAVTANGGTSSYGQSPSNPGLSATGLQNGQDVSVLAGLSNSFGVTNLTNAGSYTLNVAGALTNKNYTVIGTNTGAWTVNPAQIAVTANGGTSSYGQSPNNPGLSATGLQNGQDVSVLTGLSNSFGITNLTNAGNNALNVLGTLANSNYTVIGTNVGTWVVNPAQITVTANGGASTYGQSPSNPGFAATGLQNGQDVSVLAGLSNNFGITSFTNVGSYALNVAGKLANSNYTITARNAATWLVDPATLIYTANPSTQTSGAAFPTFTGTVNGFVNGETLASATTGTPLFSTSATPQSTPGTYGIYGSGLTADHGNYVFVQAASNATALTLGQASSGNAPSRTVPPPNPPPPNQVVINFSNPNRGGNLARVSFTPNGQTTANSQNNNTVNPSSLPPGDGFMHNNGHYFPPISQFDENQYSDFKLPPYDQDDSEATILTIIARGIAQTEAPKYMINGFWNGSEDTWPGAGHVDLLGKATFSDGAGHNVTPTNDPAFPIVAGKSDFAALLQNGPVLIGGPAGQTPPQWLLATAMTPDGKGIICDDPQTGGLVELAYDPATMTVGGITSVFDGKKNSFVALADAGNDIPASDLSGLSGLQSFVPATYYAVGMH